MPPADDDFDIYGEDDGFNNVKVDEEVSPVFWSRADVGRMRGILTYD